jgi:transposase-like protein
VVRTAQQLVEDEVTRLVGEPWSRKDSSSLRRGGSCRSRIFLDGEPVHLARTRVRDRLLGREHSLETVKALTSRDALDGDVRRLLVRGVSTRNYDPALGALADGLGLKRSAVSSAFKRAAQKDLDGINGRSLAEWRFAAIFIDGLHFADTTCLVAVGLTVDGHKHILGVLEGATENATVVSDLLASLEDRGLMTTARVLFVLDGSKALKRAVLKVYGKRALIQRCILHKERNILDYLPQAMHQEARRRLRVAFGLKDATNAKESLLQVLTWLRRTSDSAAKSLEEALDECLTVHRLGISGALRKTLQTTNPIDSAFDFVRTLTNRVKRWTGSSMILRWVGTGLTKAEQQFRRVKGHADLPAMVAALETSGADNSQSVA